MGTWVVKPTDRTADKLWRAALSCVCRPARCEGWPHGEVDALDSQGPGSGLRKSRSTAAPTCSVLSPGTMAMR